MLFRLCLIALGFLCAQGCASAPLDQGRLDEINEALANRTAIAKRCGIIEPDHAASFLASAKPRLDPEARGRLAGAASKIIASAQDEEAEYICTPEMFEQSGAAAGKAQADWVKISRSE